MNLKKIFLIIFLSIFALFLLIVLTHKEVKQFDKFTIVEIENNPFYFGTLKHNDTLKHTFRITNKTNTLFVINKVMPTCTCTVSRYDKQICRKNESINIDVKYIPKLNQKGKISSIVFVECNAKKGVIKLELTGNIK